MPGRKWRRWAIKLSRLNIRIQSTTELLALPIKCAKNEYLKWITHTVRHILLQNIWGHYIFISAREKNNNEFLPVMFNKVDGTCRRIMDMFFIQKLFKILHMLGFVCVDFLQFRQSRNWEVIAKHRCLMICKNTIIIFLKESSILTFFVPHCRGSLVFMEPSRNSLNLIYQ